jgi:hypothetical protein
MVAGQLETLLSFWRRPIRVAVAGHRLNQLPEDALPRVKAAMDAALDSIQAAGREATHKGVKFVIVSALAEGADRIAADAALARGWALIAPLPFSISRYEKDFADQASVSHFQALLKQAAKIKPAPANDANPEAGYKSVGKRVASGADIGLIVWNGEEGKGEGGTADVGAQMLDGGMPVIWIGVAERQRSKLILPDDSDARRGSRALYLRGALAARFEKTDRPANLQASG